MGMSEAAKRAKREYNNKWRRDHPEKVRQYNKTYWEKKAREKKEETEDEKN